MTPSALRAAAYRFRATFRQRWGGYLTLIVLIGLLGGVALGAIAGARRTQSSYVAYLGTIHPSDLQIFTAFANPSVGGTVGYDAATNAKIVRLPFVHSMDTIVGFDGNLDFVRGIHSHILPGEKPPVLEGSTDGEFTTQDTAHLVAGRLAHPGNPHEAIMNGQAAKEMGLHLGSVARIGLNSDDQEIAMSAPNGPSSLPPAKVLKVKIVGIVVFPQDVDENDYSSLGSAEVFLSPAATRQIDTCSAYYSNGALKLVGGRAHLSSVDSELNRLSDLPQVGGFQTWAPAIDAANRAIRPVSVALAVFGGLAALSLLFVALQVTGRQLRRRSDETTLLRALGAGRAMTMADGVAGIIGAVFIGCVVAALVSIAMSPLFPLGPVRPVYPVGVSVDATVIGLGFAALVIVLSGIALFEAYRQDLRLRSSLGRVARRPSAGTRLAAGSGLPVSAVTGVRFAVDPGDRDPVPVRSAMLGATLAVVVVIATVVFSTSLNNLVTHPNLYGWNWNYTLLSGFSGDEDLPAHQSATLLAHDRYVSAASGVYFSKASLDGKSFPIIGASPHAPVAPPLLSGHGLQAPNQIVLGGETAARLGKRVGDTVNLSGGHGRSRRLTIVGLATLPALVGPGMGVGAIIDYRLIPPAVRNTQGSAVPGPNAYFIRTRGSPSQALRSLDAISNTINSPSSPSPGSAGGVIAALRPEEIVDSHSIVAIPAVLGASLAIGASLALGTTLVASVRRRRHDLAVLKTLGLSGRQLGGIVAWQASITVGVGTIIGVPLGLILGHVLWTGFADAIYAVPVSTISPAYVAIIAVGAVVLANVVAAVPAARRGAYADGGVAARRVMSAAGPSSLAFAWLSLQRRDAATQVHRVVAEALIEARDQGYLGGHRRRHLAPADLGGQAVVQDVQLLVRLVEDNGVGLVADVGRGGGLPHLCGHLRHPLHDATGDRCHLGAEVHQRPLRDVLGQVGTALQLGDDEEDPDQLPQGDGVGGLLLDVRPDLELQLRGQLVDLLVSVDHLLSQLHVAVQEGPCGPGHGLPHQGEEIQHGLLHRGRHGPRT